MLPVENVSEYPRPPAVEPVALRLRAVFRGIPIADTQAGFRVIETDHAPAYYFPQTDILMSALVPVGHETFCNWKGRAIHYDLVVNGRRANRAAWSFPAPTARYEPLRDYIAFFAMPLDAAHVGDIRVMPQPGDIYGGWVTPNLTGRIKGTFGR